MFEILIRSPQLWLKGWLTLPIKFEFEELRVSSGGWNSRQSKIYFEVEENGFFRKDMSIITSPLVHATFRFYFQVDDNPVNFQSEAWQKPDLAT